MQVYLSVTPQAQQRTAGLVRSFAHAAYRIGPDSELLRQGGGPRGGVMSLSDREAAEISDPGPLADAVVRECLLREFSGVLLDFEGPPSPGRRALAEALLPRLTVRRRRLWAPEPCAPPGAETLVNTALSGGNLSDYLRSAQARLNGHAALDVQRLRMEFPLPCPSGIGRPLSGEELGALLEKHRPSVFFSQGLCARYFTYAPGPEIRFVLFDDAETMLLKLRTAASLGIAEAFLMYPEVSDLLPRLAAGLARL